MLSLQALQTQMTAAVLSGDFSRIAHEFTAHRGTPARRLGIFRNNTILSLTDALAATFPVTVKLVDRRFFDYAAASFIAAHPPRQARLAQYGADFPRFLARFPALARHPFVAPVAGLEWAIAEVLDGPSSSPALAGEEGDPSRLSPQGESGWGRRGLVNPRSDSPSPPPCAFGGMGPPRLPLKRERTSLRFTVSRFDALAMWRAAQSGTAINPVQRKSTRLAIWRDGENVRLAELSAPSFAFWRALAKGAALENAGGRALMRDPLFDLTAELVALMRAGLFVSSPQLEQLP